MLPFKPELPDRKRAKRAQTLSLRLTLNLSFSPRMLIAFDQFGVENLLE
jgi:hypothetical protein